MKFEHTNVYNFEGAFRGMRNPKESWDRSDSKFSDEACYYDEDDHKDCQTCELFDGFSRPCLPLIGKNDMKLAQTLIRAGAEHRKFLRQIIVSVDITAPLYWWKEFDTYKVGTVANSTSTMHKLASKPITRDCFEIDDFNNSLGLIGGVSIGERVDEFINSLERLRQLYITTNDKRYWKELIRWLPESWLQKRTVTMNYENLISMCSQRSAHKLNEWSGKDNPACANFISWVKTLPYANELIFIASDNPEEASC